MNPGTVMVVDDDLAVRDGMSALLAEEGYPVVTAVNGVDALQLLQQIAPSMMLLDVAMPSMGGAALLTHLRLRGSRLPVIVMSASAHPITGGVGVLQKPIDHEELMSFVRQHCGEPQWPIA